MRIFPEGAEEWLEPCGSALQILAISIFVIAVAAFAWRWFEIITWRITAAQVITAEVQRDRRPDDVTLCTVIYKLRYDVEGTPHTLSTTFASSSGDCPYWERRAASMIGSKQTVLYNPSHPAIAYPNSGKTLDFFVVSAVLAGLAFGFGLAGAVSKWIGKVTRKRGLALP